MDGEVVLQSQQLCLENASVLASRSKYIWWATDWEMTTVRRLDPWSSCFSACTLKLAGCFFTLLFITLLFILWNKHSHSSRKELKTSKHDKKYYPKWAWSFLFSHVIVYRQWSLYSGEFFHPSEHRCQWYPESPPDAGCQTGRAVVTWCLTAGLDSRRAASWHALCSTFSGTWSSEKKRGDLCEIRKEGRSKQTRKKIPQRKRQQNARHKVGNSHAEQ